jgi:AcrR family transcriptional regulator
MTGTRERLVLASAALLQRQGLTATGIKQILAEAHAPFSSLYHHFPGGKDELAEAAIRASGAHYQGLVETIWDEAPDVTSSVAAVFDGAARTLEETDFAVACPIATVALEVASTNESLRSATAEVFTSWIAACTARLEAENICAEDATVLALTLISLLEGAFMLSQAMKSTEPMRAAGASASSALRSVLEAPHDGAPRLSPEP